MLVLIWLCIVLVCVFPRLPSLSINWLLVGWLVACIDSSQAGQHSRGSSTAQGVIRGSGGVGPQSPGTGRKLSTVQAGAGPQVCQCVINWAMSSFRGCKDFGWLSSVFGLHAGRV